VSTRTVKRVGRRPGGKSTESGPAYRLAAGGREAAEDDRLGLLEQIYDPGSRQRRELVQVGWRCLEIGAGRGSMAVWLADQVGPSGRVVATDIDVSYLKRLNLPNLDVVEHNILERPPELLEPGSFDLVCCRFVLAHLGPSAEAALARMVLYLRPGGWLIDEDGDWGTTVLVDPLHPRYEDFNRAWRDGDWWVSRGYDPVFGRKVPALFERCGLEDIRHEAGSAVVRGGSPWSRWYGESLEVIHRLGGGATTDAQQREHEVITTAFADPSALFLRELLHACWGRRPGG
jgi:ubiquinone/menaquinone biosynthesis C-methylase UbiE